MSYVKNCFVCFRDYRTNDPYRKRPCDACFDLWKRRQQPKRRCPTTKVNEDKNIVLIKKNNSKYIDIGKIKRIIPI